jgi:hypothetical protein
MGGYPGLPTTPQPTPTKQTLVNSKGDLPSPVGGVITLAAETLYVLGDDINLGTDRLVFSDGSILSGIDSLNILLDYTGTGDMMTFSDVTARVDCLAISCANGRIFNWSCTSLKIFRASDITVVDCDKLGVFNSVDGVLRFTNFSPASITTDGIEFIGDFRSFLYDTSATTIAAGAIFNLGVATFDSFIADTVLATLNGSSNLVSGAAASANINAGGIGLIERMRVSGTGTTLAGISPDDALWEFAGNDDIQNTRPDGLLSLQGNATATTITVAGTPVLIAGTWTVERASQFTGTAGGRLTYNGGKNAVLPISGSFTVEPVSGGAVNIAIEVAVNGVAVANSKRVGNASAGNPTSISIPWQEDFATADSVEWFVTNEDTTVDVLVSSGTGRVN